jgi:cytochrome c-type biogenesis protein
MEVSIGLAFLGGIVSFFSPCVLPVIPAYFSFLVGSSLNRDVSRKDLLIQSIFFVAGFSVVFILLGISASALGRWIGAYRPILSRIGGAIVILFGLHMLGVLKIRWLMMEKRIHLESSAKASGGRAFLLGLSFAAGWTPCIGPVLSSILFLAGSTGNSGQASFLLFIYSLGLAIPFLVFALVADKAVLVIRRSGGIVLRIQWIGGVILILLGIALLFDWIGRISAFIPVIPLPY